MKTVISVEELYLNSRTGEVEIPILKDVVPYLSRSPGISGKVLAKLLDVKRSALSSAIFLLTGMNLNDMLRQWRLLHAMYLLSCTTISYQEVARQCGYRTVDGLTKFMERNLKCTAREYRENRVHGNRLSR